MNNTEIAKLLEQMAILLEIDGANPFRVRAYQRAAEVIEGLPRPAAALTAEELLEVPGIGKGIADHLQKIAASGTFPELEAMRAKVPRGLLDLLRLPGLGPKRARHLHDQLGIDSLDKLRAAAQAGRLRALPGFGPKIEQNILEGLAFAAQPVPRMLHWEARQLAMEVLNDVRAIPGVAQAVAAGSLRRGRETVGDLDIVCAAADAASAVAAFTASRQVERVIAAGATKASVWLKAGIQCDLRAVAPEAYGAALQYFTGSKDHNVALRAHAQRQGLTVNEYGVFRAEDTGHARPLAGRTEEEVYAKLGMAWIPPELREDTGEIDAALAGRLPRLVELKDVRGDFHNHSSHTDGADSLLEMALAASKRGWDWIALGDHSQSLKVANGMSVERLRQSMAELDAIRPRVAGLALLRSMEVDILKDGRLDYPDDVLGEIDVVIGSVHSHFKQDEKTMTERIIRAARSPHCDILGHLSGRRLNKREGYKVDSEAVFRAAAAAGTAVEINGQPERQDLWEAQARRARELKVPLALNTDAHSTNQFQYMECAVTIARRAWLTRADLLNCLSLRELRSWLKN